MGYSYLTVLIKVRNVGRMSLCECVRTWVGVRVCVHITMLMRTIIFLHLESISRDYDDGLPRPYEYQD